MRERIPRPTVVTAEIISPGPITPEVGKLALRTRQAVAEAYDSIRGNGGAGPGEFPEWDAAAWERLQARVGYCHCGDQPRGDCPLGPYMLMYHESDSRAAFKHRDTRNYLFA